MSNKLNPLTGLPYENSGKASNKVNPLTGEAYSSLPVTSSPKARPQLITTQYADNISKYQKYNVPLRQEFNWDEQRAQRQSTAEKWGHGLLKAGVTTVGSIADNTLGVLEGIGGAVINWDATKLYDTSVGKLVDKTNNWMQENVPNYYTEAERNSTALESLGYANFWADKVANGLGYAIGSVGTVYLTGGAGLATRGISAASKGLKTYRAAKAVAGGVKAEEAIRRGAAFGRFQKSVQVGEIGAMMSYGESSVEAREVLHRTTEKLTNQRAKELGIRPSQLSAADIKEIKETSSHAANVAFGLNMAVLSTTNLITFGKMLLPKYTNMRPAVKAISKNSKTGKFVDEWAESPLWKTTAQRYLKTPAISGVTETFQEGTQFAIQEAADKISNSGKGSIEDWTEAMVEGYGETFGTKEGQESMMLGFIVGGLMGGAGSFRQRLNKEEGDKGRKQIVDALNSDTFVNTVDNAQTLLRAAEASQKMQVALEEGDHKGYRDAQFELIAQQIKFHEARGSMDLFMEKLDDAAKLPDSEFATAFGIPEGVKFDKAEIITGVKSKIKDYQTLKNQIDAQFPSLPKQGMERVFMSKEQKEQEENELQDEEFYKSLLLDYGLNLNDSNKRISSLIEEINQLREEAGLTTEAEKVTEEDLNLITTFAQKEEGEKDEKQEAIDNKLKDILEKVSSTNPLFKDVIESKVKDLVDLSRSRDIARSSLSELYADPKTRKRALDRAKKEEKKKENDRRDSLVREKINDSRNSDHIVELLKSEDISEELKQELNEEYNQRVVKEGQLDNELYYKTLEEVEEMLKDGISNNADPFKLWVMKRHVSSRRKSGEVNAREKKESTNTEDRKAAREERKARREEEKKALREDQKEESEESPNTSGDIITSSEENTSTGDTVTTAAGEFNTDASYNLIVDSDGKVTVGRDSNQPSAIDRSISQKEGLEGTEVELRLLDPVQVEGGEVQAVGVFIEGNLAGVLGETGAIKVRSRLKAGETIKGEVSERYFNNVNNLRTETGEKVFLPANEALQGLTGFVGYAIYAGSVEGETSPRYDFGEQEGVTEAANALNKGSRANDAKFTPGQVVLVVKTPRGEFKPIAVSTNELGRESVGTVLDSLSEGTLQGIIDARELAGITKMEDSPSAFTISQSGVVSMPFNGEIIEITPEELAAIREGIYNPERPELTPEVLEALKTTIAELKTQVALENLGINSTYLSPRTNKSYSSYREYIEAEVLKTDFKVINGSVFNNVGIVISLSDVSDKNEIIESFSFEEESDTIEQDTTTKTENEGKEASGKFGDGLLRLSGETLNAIDTKKAKAWLQKRFGKKVGIIIFDNLQKIGDDVIHGYMENAAIHLYKNAEVGTEYHEGFHLFFRGLLTDEQRQSLYDDAVAEFGEPTADDIKNARRGKPDLSTKEARLLALEEKMAEEFRDYALTEEAPKTLGQKIAKFFKDLLAYIKALATDRVSVRQAFRLLEGNKIPKAFTRNASSFSPGKTYMLKEYTQTPRLHKEKIDLILYSTLTLLDSGNFTIEELLGNVEDKESLLRDWFLRHALSKEGQPLTSEDFKTFKEVYDSAENVEDVKKVMSDLGIKVSPPMTDFAGNPIPGKTAGNRKNGLRFIAVYDNWFDQESELGGLPTKGFRAEVTDRLKTDFGYKVEDDTEVDTESEFERLFSLSRLEEEPAKKLSQKAKRVLSRIPVQDLSDSFFGFQTYMPITDVFNELSGAVADSANLVDMLENLKQQKNSVNSLNAVYDFVISLGAQEQALLFSTLALGMNAHRTLLISQTDNGAQTIIFSPVKATIKKYYTNKWRNSAVGGNGVYKTAVNDNGDFVGYTVDPAIISEIQKNAKVLFEGLENPGAKEIEAFSNALWAMGMPLASSKAASRQRALEVFSIDGKYKENLEVFIKSTQLESILTQKFAPGKDSYTNIFETESTTVGKIADMIMSKFESPKAASFLGGTGNMIYALNLKSDLIITKEMIRTGEYGEMFTNAIGHETERTTSLGTALLNNLNYQELFEPIDLDASKFISEEGEDVKEYSTMTFEDALSISLNMAFPSSGNVRYIAIDTQGDRDRLTFIPIPKWEQRKVKGLFDLNQTVKQGTFAESTRSIIENYILLDLHRISKELTMKDRDELMTYHTENRFRSFQVGGELDASQNSIAHDAASYMDNPNIEMSEELMKFLDSKVEEVLSNFEEYYNEIVKKVGGEYNLKKLVINKVDNRSYIKGKETDLVKSFVVHDMIGRLISREIFRAGVNHVTNGANYNKRSALTTTPGTILMLAGDSASNLDYGMSPTFNEITVKDIYTSLPKKQLDNLKKALTKQVGKDEANNIIKAYTRSNSTDAQAFISPSMYRNIRMGMGLWSKEDQDVYENYLNTDKWSGSIMPLKPSYEFRVKHQGRIIPISHKNSYIVLTKELAEGNDTLSKLLDRMEAAKEFEGLSPVDVVNVETAKKTGSFAPIDAEDANALASAPVMVLDSRGLKFPQILPEKNSYKITFGRQPRKNMIANISRENDYFLDGVKVSGEELFNIYQEAITAKLQKNTDKVLKRLGYDKVLNAENADERLKALNELLPKLQELMTELGVEKDYPQNILDALEIVKDENGNLSTAIPLAFPQVQSKLQQLLFGMFRKEIYQQKMLGMEMVQFSEFAGKSEVDNSLKFYDVKNGKVTAVEVDIRYDVLERLGIDPSLSKEQISEKLMTLIGYRIPQQGKSSTLIMKVRNILPPSHKASIRVPGAVTTMMGSDFDIDKMFVLFPEARVNKDGSVDKVSIDYSRLKKSKDFASLSLKQLNNIIFDSLVAVGTNINHLSETIAPLDIVDIEEARDAIGKSKESIDINNPATRLQTGVDNMLSGILRGIYANGVGGRNVAEASTILFEGIPIFVDEVSLSYIRTKSPFTGKYTDYYLSQYLSAAVDSVKDPIQAAINDNALTAPLTIYMLSIGMTPKQIVAFLNVPIVKAQIEEGLKTEKSIKNLLRDIEVEEVVSLNTDEMLSIVSGENKDYSRSKYLKSLKTIALQADSLDRLYKTISPDSIDKAGTIPQHLEKLDVKSSAEASSPVFGGSEALAALTEQNSYKIVRAYYEAISKSLDLASDLGFISNQEGVQNFKKALKSVSGRQTLTAEMHRDINRALLHYLVTKPGSPIFESDLLLETKVLYNHMEGGLESLLSDMKEITEGTSNAVVESLILETTETQKGEFSKYSLDVDKVNTTLQKNYFTATLRGMMDNPSLYGEENKETVEKFTEAFVSNSIVTSGFAPSPTATFSLIPVEYFKRLKVGEHIRNEIKNLESDTNFPMELTEFIINYGYQKFGGKYIFKTPYKGNLTNTIAIPNRNDAFIIANKKDKKTKVITTAVYQQVGRGTYKRIQTKGQQRLLYEANLKSSDGKLVPMNRSMINSIITSEITPPTAKTILRATPVQSTQPSKSTQQTSDVEIPKVNIGEPTIDVNIGPDTGIFEIKQGNKVIGYISVSFKGTFKEGIIPKGTGEAFIAGVKIYKEDDKGKRFGTSAYVEVGNYMANLGYTLSSGINTSASAKRVWESLVKRGLAIKSGNSFLYKPTQQKSINKSKISLLERETPTGASEKIARLRENFAAAGIDVTVVEAELPPGEKGQVVGDLIVIDPNQIEADTVYHEFGHILVDMLPADEVDAYIEQVKKANPELVDIVTAKYPELSGRDLGKEILVTAIGLEGARIERKSPSKLQRIVNKILRALGKLFGVKPNAASILAERMFAGEIRAEMLTGDFNPKVQKSRKLQDDITKTFEDVTITLKRQLIRLENLPETEKTKSRIREIKTLQKNLSNIEENMSDMSQFLNFQQYVVARVDTLEVLMDKIYDLKDQKLSSKEALQVLKNIGEIKETIDSLYNTQKDKSTIHKMKKLMRTIPFGNTTSLEVAEVRMDLEDAIDRLEDLEQDYQNLILPLVADTLLTFGDTSINDTLDKEIERVKKTKDISSFRRFSYSNKNPEYLALKKKRKDMTPEEYKDAMVEVKINDLKNKRLGREQIIAELRDAHTSKGRFSYYLDPMVYSNEANMQLFALSIKDAINNASEKSRGFLYSLEKQYSKFKSWKGKDFNEEKFNEDLLTTTKVTKADGSTIKLLSLVQEYDVEDFYSKRNAVIENLNKKHKKPAEVSELPAWRKSNNGKLHRQELSKWYKENTTGIEGAEKLLNNMRLKASQITKEINDLSKDDIDAKNILNNELSDLINKIKNSYKGGVYMGDLAVPSEKYKSSKYKKIMSTPELKEYYNFIVESYHASQKKIGKSELFINSWDKYSYIMPSVRKDRLASLQQEGWIELAKENIKDFRRLETDTQFGVMTNADGGKVKSIPRFYTNQVSYDQVSKDIASSLAQFTHMANTFEEKSNVVGLVETMLTLHENRKTLSIDAVTGLPVIDNIASRVTKRDNSYVLKPGVENNAYKHLQEFVDSVFYGQFDIDEGSLFGANISKLAGKAAAFTATANLAFNSLQIGNQFVLDNLMGGEESIAGQFYSKSDFAWAAKTYAEMKGALGDLGKFVPKSKLGQAMQMFDALNEVSDTIGKNLTGNKLKKAIQSDPLFALQHAVEHQSTGTRMLALLHATKVTDENNKAILNENGSEANLWDMLIKDKNGKFIIDPRVKNVDKNRIIAKLHGINKRTNQVKGSLDRSMGSRRALGKLLLLFRNYFIPGLRKRFGHGEAYHVDHELGDVTRGMYLSVISYIGSLAEGQGIASSYQMMSETDKQNLKRSLYEAASAMTATVVFGMLNSMIDMDDDDEDSYALVYSAYQARRLQSELLQFINPGEFMRIIESPMATVNWASKYYDIITQVTLKEPGYFLGLVDEDKIFYQRRTGTAEKGDRKVFNQVKKVVPILNGWQTSFLNDTGSDATKEKIRWFEQ